MSRLLGIDGLEGKVCEPVLNNLGAAGALRGPVGGTARSALGPVGITPDMARGDAFTAAAFGPVGMGAWF